MGTRRAPRGQQQPGLCRAPAAGQGSRASSDQAAGGRSGGRPRAWEAQRSPKPAAAQEPRGAGPQSDDAGACLDIGIMLSGAALFASEAFLITSFKVLCCPQRKPHDWKMVRRARGAGALGGRGGRGRGARRK